MKDGELYPTREEMFGRVEKLGNCCFSIVTSFTLITEFWRECGVPLADGAL
jgi:hypothetical protein